VRKTSDSLVARAICRAVQPAVQEVATRLFYLTTYRPGSRRHKPTVLNLYETTFAQAVFEHLLMDPTVGHLDIRHEMKCGKERVDLWLRHTGGGIAHFIEIGFFAKLKVEDDLKKLTRLKPSEARWFLCLFRGERAKNCGNTVSRSLRRANGLDGNLMTFNIDHSGHFEVYRPGKQGEFFGYALIKGK
jgi:hypothetical protein